MVFFSHFQISNLPDFRTLFVMIYTGGHHRRCTVGQSYNVGETQKEQVGSLTEFLFKEKVALLARIQ